jgi:hypothetical protein
MTPKIDGDGNTISGRDSIVQHVKLLNERVERIGSIFERIDSDFASVAGSKTIIQRDLEKTFSSESLCTSLASIGIPIATALDVVESVIPLLRFEAEREIGLSKVFSTNDIKLCVLQAIAGLQYRSFEKDRPINIGSDQIATWSTAYVRRYGGSNMYLQVVDHGTARDLNFEFLRDEFIPHLIGKLLFVPPEVNPIEKYRKVFTLDVVRKMATEIMAFSNALNLYAIRYETLFYLTKDIVITPPHPWLVTAETVDSIVDYNSERAIHHLQVISSDRASAAPEIFAPSAHECVSHLCACILAHYGCLLGVESRYGLIEFIRICEMKKSERNLVLWSHCGLDKFQEDIEKVGFNLVSIESWLKRLHSSLAVRFSAPLQMSSIVQNCNRLKELAFSITQNPRLSDLNARD